MAKQPETILKEKVLARLKTFPNAWVCKIQQVSKAGTPDILMCLCGVFIAIELKSKGGKLSALQIYNLVEIGKAGGVSIVIDPDNLEEAFDLLTLIAEVGKKGHGENPVFWKESLCSRLK